MKHIIGPALLLALLGGCTASEPAAGPEQTQTAPLVTSVSTRLLVKLTRAGTAEIVVAVEEPGIIVVPRRLKGKHAYEVVAGGQVMAASSFPDPFIRRPMTDGDAPPQIADEGTVAVRVPGIGLSNPNYELRFHEMATPIHTPIDLDGPAIASLAKQGAIRTFARLDRAEVAAGVAAKGKRAVRPQTTPPGLAPTP